MKKLIAMLLALVLALSLCACGAKQTETQGSEPAEAASADSAEKVFRSADTWMYDSLDPHVDYQGWNTASYGVCETLFFMDDSSTLVPMLAVSGETPDDGTTWVIKLRDDVKFSDGDALTASIVIDNMKDIASKNGRYPYLETAEMEATNDTTVTIKLEKPYLTLLQDFSDPDTSLVKVGDGQDLVNAPVGTGPFVVESFKPAEEVVVVRNDNYWNGTAKIDRAEFTLVPDFDTQMMAMQDGELSVLNSPTAAALEVFSADPDNYSIVSIPTSRNLFFYLNCETLSDNVRKAINLAVNPDEIKTLMGDTVQLITGPFIDDMPYGKCTKPAHDLDAAKAAMEADGYTLNANGLYEKDGEVPTLRLYYYPSRSIDKISALVQEQLAAAGIQTELKSFDDPDAGYVTVHDFDIGMYSFSATPGGDPYYFLSLTMGKDSSYNGGNYQNDQVQALLDEMASEPDTAKRAELANQIVQLAIDDNAFGYLLVYNQISILRSGVSNVGENNPNHGGLNVNSTVG